MANNVGTPRFWVNTTEYYNSMGIVSSGSLKDDGHLSLNPTEDRLWAGGATTGINDTRTVSFSNDVNKLFGDKCFVALLGHNLDTAKADYHLQSFGVDYQTYSAVELVNVDTYGGVGTVRADGFSITSFEGSSCQANNNSLSLRLDASLTAYDTHPKINSVIIGEYYDMPHSPDLSLKLSYEMDGVKNIQTKGGATLSNALYTKPADWGSGGAWQLGNNQNYRSGRRVWDLSFSYLSDTHVMPVLGIQNYDEATTTDILDSPDFFSQVWNKTMGGHLPFIFQADNSTNSPDGFAICRFDMNSLEYDQVANNVYNVKLKIRESW